MNTGKETWKWGLVVLLLTVFLITANQAYQHIAKQETFEAPDDYLKGDSWDLEHQTGPGAGQPFEVTNPNANTNNNLKLPTPNKQNNQRLNIPKPIDFDDKSDWDNKSEKKETKPVSIIYNNSN